MNKLLTKTRDDLIRSPYVILWVLWYITLALLGGFVVRFIDQEEYLVNYSGLSKGIVVMTQDLGGVKTRRMDISYLRGKLLEHAKEFSPAVDGIVINFIYKLR